MGGQVVFEHNGQPKKKCRSCGAPIFWIKTRGGKWMPVNWDEKTSHFATCPAAKKWRKEKTPFKPGLICPECGGELMAIDAAGKIFFCPNNQCGDFHEAGIIDWRKNPNYKDPKKQEGGK